MINLSTRVDDDSILAREFKKEFLDLYPKKSGTSNKDYRQMQKDYVSTRIIEIVLREGDNSGLIDASGNKTRYSLLLNPTIGGTASKIPELRPLDELTALRMVDDPDLRELIDLTLSNVYKNDDSKERRIRAGQILEYSKLRLSLHELLRKS